MAEDEVKSGYVHKCGKFEDSCLVANKIATSHSLFSRKVGEELEETMVRLEAERLPVLLH